MRTLRRVPLALLLDLSRADYWDIRNRILDVLKEWHVDSRLTSGSVLPVLNDVQSLGFSAFVPGQGRIVETYSESRNVGAERRADAELARSVHVLRGNVRDLPSPLGGSTLECLSVAGLAAGDDQKLVNLIGSTQGLVVALTFDERNPLHRLMFWDRLILVGLTRDGRRLDHYEDMPDDLSNVERRGFFVPSPMHYRQPGSDGFFFDAGAIYFDESNAGLLAVPDLPLLDHEYAVREDPVASAMRASLAESAPRISTQDDPASVGSFDLPLFRSRFADPLNDLRKIEAYCLSPLHPDEKWRGFAHHGYRHRGPINGTLLSAFLAGALQEPLEPMEARVTADGSLQFGMEVALPRPWGGYAVCTTAWIVERGGSPRLATAFMAGRSLAALTRPPLLPWNGFLSFGALFDCVVDSAETYAEQYPNDGITTWGFLWIRHDDERSAHFARWVRRYRKDWVGTVVSRAAWRGRATQVVVGGYGSLCCDAWLARAQALLLQAGVWTHTELRVD